MGALVALASVTGVARAQTFSYGRSIFLHGLKRSGCEYINNSSCPGPIPFSAPDSLTARGVILGTPVVYSDGGDPTVATRVAALRATLDGASSSAVVIGHSMGGVVARTAYFSNSSKIAGIVTLDSPIRGAPIASSGPAARSMGRAIGRNIANSTIPILDNNILVRITLNAIVNNQMNKIMDGFFDAAGLSSAGAQDLKTTSTVITSQQDVTDPLPHANVMGQVPTRHAMLRLAASLQYDEAQYAYYARLWDKTESATRKCSVARFAMFVSPLLAYIGHQCRTVYKILTKADGQWYRLTRTPSDYAAFDGFITHTRLAYPGLSAGDPRRVTANGANHLNITYVSGGVTATANAMKAIGMQP
jgi:pimeloyl-ACP methyl ester carboxylesterase